MKTITLISSLVLLLLALIASSYFIYEERTFIYRSRANVQQADPDNSLAVSIPSCVPGDKVSISRVQVYCLNPRGFGEPKMVVSVKPTSSVQNLEIKPIQGTTDEMGKAIFDLTSDKAGIFDLTITCGDIVVKTNHKACFTSE